MMQTLLDFGLTFKMVSLKCDSKSAMDLSNNHVHHSHTKHIDVRHYLIREYISNEDICIEFISIESQLVDIFTKPLLENRFSQLCLGLGILEMM